MKNRPSSNNVPVPQVKLPRARSSENLQLLVVQLYRRFGVELPERLRQKYEAAGILRWAGLPLPALAAELSAKERCQSPPAPLEETQQPLSEQQQQTQSRPENWRNWEKEKLDALLQPLPWKSKPEEDQEEDEDKNEDEEDERRRDSRSKQRKQQNDEEYEAKDAAWPKLQPLEEYLSPVLPVTADMMPEALGDWVTSIAAGLRCSLDFAAVSAVVATGSAVASRVRIRPLHYKPWQIAPNLWGGIIGEPGTKKSPTMAEVFKALDRLKMEEAQAFEKAEEAHQRALSDYAREVKVHRDTIDQLRRKQVAGRADERDAERLGQLKTELEELLTRAPKAPQRRRYRLNDPTIEALQKLLKMDHTCLLVDRDELTGMLSQWEMDGHQNDRPFYLESWNGLYPYDGSRIGRGDFFISCLCLSLFGGIQPAKLVQYLRNPKVCLTTDGALQRFQLLVYPNRVPVSRLVDQYENTEAKNRFFEIIKKLAHADFHNFGGMSDEFNRVPWFHFSIEAKEQFEDWHWRNELLIADKETSPLLRQHFAKFDKLLCSIALIFHLIELADERISNPNELKTEGYIPLRIFDQAERWVEYLKSHARRIYGLSENPSVSAAMLLGAKLKDPKIKNPLSDGFTARDIERHHWVGLSSGEDINSALARLCDANWLREQPSKTTEKGGRPTIQFNIHPDILASRNDGPFGSF